MVWLRLPDFFVQSFDENFQILVHLHPVLICSFHSSLSVRFFRVNYINLISPASFLWFWNSFISLIQVFLCFCVISYSLFMSVLFSLVPGNTSVRTIFALVAQSQSKIRFFAMNLIFHKLIRLITISGRNAIADEYCEHAFSPWGLGD